MEVEKPKQLAKSSPSADPTHVPQVKGDGISPRSIDLDLEDFKLDLPPAFSGAAPTLEVHLPTSSSLTGTKDLYSLDKSTHINVNFSLV